ncbi:MAG: hypothetical protein C0624_08425 [Desulfuromonas sp.]|nr:MAG: hypothetical protein C0624_08425 [Desulfuromonas sp.]
MKHLLIALSAVMALSGCTIFNEAYLLDDEYGIATRTSFNGQIAYPDYRYANTTPEGMEGVNAEGTMDIYNKSFQESPAQEINLFEFGVAGKE